MKVTIAPDFRDLFRPLTDEEFEQAKANNLEDPDHDRIPPVVVWDGIIIDGHHTHRIRESLRVNGKPVTIKYHTVDFTTRDAAMAYAIHAQLGRRNLDQSQIAIALSKLPKAKPGRKPQENELDANLRVIPTREEMAAEAGISKRTLTHADKVHSRGAKAVVDAVTAGDIKVSDAASIADLPKKEQTAALTKVKKGKAKTLKAAAGTPEEPRDGEAAQKKAKTLAHAYRDKLARAICDYHELKPNRSQRDRLVKLVQGVQLW